MAFWWTPGINELKPYYNLIVFLKKNCHTMKEKFVQKESLGIVSLPHFLHDFSKKSVCYVIFY